MEHYSDNFTSLAYQDSIEKIKHEIVHNISQIAFSSIVSSIQNLIDEFKTVVLDILIKGLKICLYWEHFCYS